MRHCNIGTHLMYINHCKRKANMTISEIIALAQSKGVLVLRETIGIEWIVFYFPNGSRHRIDALHPSSSRVALGMLMDAITG